MLNADEEIGSIVDRFKHPLPREFLDDEASLTDIVEKYRRSPERHLAELNDDIRYVREVVKKYDHGNDRSLFLKPELAKYLGYLEALRKAVRNGTGVSPRQHAAPEGLTRALQCRQEISAPEEPRVLDINTFRRRKGLREIVTPSEERGAAKQASPDSLQPPIVGQAGEHGPAIVAPQEFLDLPLLHALLGYYDGKGIIGEEKVRILQTLCLIHKLSFGVEGYPGSGKSFLVNTLLDLVDREKLVYEVGLNSDTAVFYDEARVNQKTFLYIPELQKAIGKAAGSKLEELIKSIIEGAVGERKVNRGGRVRVQRIQPKPLIYTVAIGNAVWESYLKGNKEFRRRVIGLTTDNSYEHQQEVKRSKASQRFHRPEIRAEIPVAYLREHVASCLAMPPSVFVDPFSEYIDQYIPTTSLSGAYVQHYYNLVDACAKFNHQQRVRQGNTIFISVEDHYLIHALYFKDFVETLRGFSVPEDNGELETALAKTVDWKACYEDGCAKMKQEYPLIFETWVASQQKDGRLMVYNPLQRSLINLMPPT